MYSIINFVF